MVKGMIDYRMLRFGLTVGRVKDCELNPETPGNI